MRAKTTARVSSSKRQKYSAAEWQVRVDLAACYRLVHHHRMTDLIYNHISARVPDAEHHYLINPYGLMYEEVTASNLVKIDLEGNILEDTPYEINPAGYVIHSAIHGARDDVACVLHTHSRAGAAISALKEGLVPVNQAGFQFYNRIAYHDYEGIALDLEERRRFVADLGDKRAMILRNHGLLVCGRDIPEAFRIIYYLEQACRARLDALQTGREIVLPSAEVQEYTAQQWTVRQWDAAGDREWQAMLRMLDRIDPSYRE
ncbi:MAG: class II aldolase/adducin family protein [Rhodospirillales bacterium]|nr:class II aldolase/adducin family protein [Rhodospirillales bacterium]